MVSEHIRRKFDSPDEYARLIVQADVGAGESYLLKAVALRCQLRKLRFECCAPTGIAAANIEVEGTDVAASTIHKFFNLNIGADNQPDTKLDLSNAADPTVNKLMEMQVLLLDEGSPRT